MTYAGANCICLGFHGSNYLCHINLRPEVNRANEVHMCELFCKNTNCKGHKFIK